MRVLLWAGLAVAACCLLVGPRAAQFDWQMQLDGPTRNTALAEALAWQRGELALEEPYYEAAEVDGRYYNVVGLALTILLVPLTCLSSLFGGPADGVQPWLLIPVIVVPLPLAAWWAFRSVGLSPAWTAGFTIYLLAGTSLAPVLAVAGQGSIYYINHVLAVVGLLLIGGELVGKRRIWPAAIGLLLAAWSRQLSFFYAAPLIVLAWIPPPTADGNPPGRFSPWQPLFGVAALVIAVWLPARLNMAKFGDPLQSGYDLIYQDRTDPIAKRGREALFGTQYLPMHLYAMNLAYPAPDVRKSRLFLDVSNTHGGSIWLTSPILLGVVLTARRWWRDVARRGLMLASFAVMLGLMLYHTTGQDPGYYRYALDFIPIWLLVIAPTLARLERRNLFVICLVYSCAYHFLLP